jgi:hypothetical protein
MMNQSLGSKTGTRSLHQRFSQSGGVESRESRPAPPDTSSIRSELESQYGGPVFERSFRQRHALSSRPIFANELRNVQSLRTPILCVLPTFIREAQPALLAPWLGSIRASGLPVRVVVLINGGTDAERVMATAGLSKTAAAYRDVDVEVLNSPVGGKGQSLAWLGTWMVEQPDLVSRNLPVVLSDMNAEPDLAWITAAGILASEPGKLVKAAYERFYERTQVGYLGRYGADACHQMKVTINHLADMLRRADSTGCEGTVEKFLEIVGRFDEIVYPFSGEFALNSADLVKLPLGQDYTLETIVNLEAVGRADSRMEVENVWIEGYQKNRLPEVFSALVSAGVIIPRSSNTGAARPMSSEEMEQAIKLAAKNDPQGTLDAMANSKGRKMAGHLGGSDKHIGIVPSLVSWIFNEVSKHATGTEQRLLLNLLRAAFEVDAGEFRFDAPRTPWERSTVRYQNDLIQTETREFHQSHDPTWFGDTAATRDASIRYRKIVATHMLNAARDSVRKVLEHLDGAVGDPEGLDSLTKKLCGWIAPAAGREGSESRSKAA